MNSKETRWEYEYKPLPAADCELEDLHKFHSTLEGTGVSQRRRGSMSRALRGSVTQIHALADTAADNALVRADVKKCMPTQRQQIASWDLDGTFFWLLRLAGYTNIAGHIFTQIVITDISGRKGVCLLRGGG